MNKIRSSDRDTGASGSRAELRATERRTRALSHLERVRGKAPRRRSGRALYLATGAIAALLGALTGSALRGHADWLWPDSRIAAISVRGARHLAPQEIAEASGVAPDATLVSVEPEAVAMRLAEHEWIASARTLRLPTGTLVISVAERRPAGRVADAGSEAVHLVDATGTPFAVAAEDEGRDLPLVRVAAALVPREANPAVAQALALADGLRRFGLPAPIEIGVSPDGDPIGFTLALSGVIPRVILGWEDFEPKLRELARVIAAELPEFASATELDLRFAGRGILRNDPLPEGAEQAAAGRGYAPPST